MLKRVLLIMLALVSMSCVSTFAHSDNRSELSQSTLYETPELILDEKVLDTPSLDTRIRARDIINGEDMTMVKKTAFPFMITLLCVWALIIYAHALRIKDKK